MLRNKIERLEKELKARGNGGEPVDLAVWPANKREICRALGIDPDDVADNAQAARDVGHESIAAQVASMLGMTVGEFLKALRAKARGGGLS